MEYTALISTASLLVMTGVTYSVGSRKDREKDQPGLIRTYNRAELASRRFLRELEEYTHNHHCQNDHFKRGLSFGESVLFLENTRSVLFSKAHRKALMAATTSELDLGSLMEQVIAHQEKVDELHSYLKRYFLKEYPAGVPQ